MHLGSGASASGRGEGGVRADQREAGGVNRFAEIARWEGGGFNGRPG